MGEDPCIRTFAGCPFLLWSTYPCACRSCSNPHVPVFAEHRQALRIALWTAGHVAWGKHGQGGKLRISLTSKSTPCPEISDYPAARLHKVSRIPECLVSAARTVSHRPHHLETATNDTSQVTRGPVGTEAQHQTSRMQSHPWACNTNRRPS